MFDPSDQLHNYFIGQGMSELEAYREASLISGRCIMQRAQTKPDRTSVNSADNKTMDNTSDNQEPDSEIIDLGFDVSEADVARPVLRNGTYDAVIAFARPETTRQKGLPQLVIGYRLTEPTTDINGKEVGEGFTIIQRVLMQPSGGYTERMMKDRLGRIHFAAAGPGRVSTKDWIGKPVRVRVTLREPHRDEATGQEYDASNDIGGVYPPTKSAGADA